MIFKVNSSMFDEPVTVVLDFYLSGLTKITTIPDTIISTDYLGVTPSITKFNPRYFFSDKLLQTEQFELKTEIETENNSPVYLYKIDFNKVIVKEPSKYIVKILEEKNILRKELRKLLQFSHSTLHRFVNQNEVMTYENLYKVAKFLKINPNELIIVAENFTEVNQFRNEKFLNELDLIF